MRSWKTSAFPCILLTHLSTGVVPSQVVSTSPLSEPVSIILNQLEGPLEILGYSASYQEGEEGGRGGVIRHKVHCQNVGELNFVAVEITTLSFDVWNELLDRNKRTYLRALKPGDECELISYDGIPPGADGSTFHTGVTYVSRIRFEDGEIWSADLSEIAAVLTKTAPHLSPSSL